MSAACVANAERMHAFFSASVLDLHASTASFLFMFALRTQSVRVSAIRAEPLMVIPVTKIRKFFLTRILLFNKSFNRKTFVPQIRSKKPYFDWRGGKRL